MRSGSPTGAVSGSDTYLLDSSVLIPSLRGNAAMSARISQVSQAYVSSIVLGELYVGAFGSPTRTDEAVTDVEGFVLKMVVLQPDATTARIYGQAKHDLKRRGLTMPDNDIWIAASAMQYNITLAARDAHFNWITGLHVEQW